jgi:hypothetical protein
MRFKNNRKIEEETNGKRVRRWIKDPEKGAE